MATNFLDDLFDKAGRVFEKVLDYDLQKFELDLIKQAQAGQQAEVAQAAPVAPFNVNALLPILVIGAAGVGLVLLLRK